jgi:GH15 family glucan-1,4-alpha-glucosidase
VPLEISDYALIGDCETAALVGRDGSIDWLCWPRFDDNACFTKLLGDDEHGRWRIAPEHGTRSTRRRYREGTLILETEFDTGDGAVRLVDFMPIRKDSHRSEIVRIVEGVSGNVPLRMDLRIRFDYGRIVPWVTRENGGRRLRAVAGPHSVTLETPITTRGEDYSTVAGFTVAAGDRVPFVLAYEASHLPPPRLCDWRGALEETEAFWTDWIDRCNYRGDWPEAVKRSLVTVKALTYRPTGGIVAAPTTSLPERIGGERNWDYRYCWLRDASFTLLSLINAGYREEAESWCNWLLRAVAGAANQVQPLYGVAGEHRNDETELDWLPGYRGSRPVRIGNSAYKQLQIDVFGHTLDALHEARALGLSLHEASSSLERELLRHLEDAWRDPDEGIWEIRAGRRHFVHSKLMAWVAFDRAVTAAEKFGFDGPVERWRRLRGEIKEEILARGWNPEKQAFTQAYGGSALDAAVLLMPIMGFLPPDDPRMVSTVHAIETELVRDGLVLRYDTKQAVDGLEGEEGAFLACSFWLVDNLVLQGRRSDARKLFDRLLGLRNDVGLLAEQWDWEGRKQVGNFPQAFSHFALIDAAFNLQHEEGTAREAQNGGDASAG